MEAERRVQRIADDATLMKPVRAALPEYGDYLDKFGLAGTMHLVDPLKAKLLAALESSLEGHAVDRAAIVRAGEILKAVAEAAKADTAQLEAAAPSGVAPPRSA